MDRKAKIELEIVRLKKTYVCDIGFQQPEENGSGNENLHSNPHSIEAGSSKGNGGGRRKVSLFNLLRRPWLSWNRIAEADPVCAALPPPISAKVQVEVKYSGYIERQKGEIERFQKIEGMPISMDFDYSTVPGLKKEAREKLSKIKPITLGQAARISGITPSDISILSIFIKKFRGLGSREASTIS